MHFKCNMSIYIITFSKNNCLSYSIDCERRCQQSCLQLVKAVPRHSVHAMNCRVDETKFETPDSELDALLNLQRPMFLQIAFFKIGKTCDPMEGSFLKCQCISVKIKVSVLWVRVVTRSSCQPGSQNLISCSFNVQLHPLIENVLIQILFYS